MFAWQCTLHLLVLLGSQGAVQHVKPCRFETPHKEPGNTEVEIRLNWILCALCAGGLGSYMTECETLPQYLKDSRDFQEISEWRLLGSQGAVQQVAPFKKIFNSFCQASKQARRKAAANIE
jgi:hypothetical protein